MSNLTGDVLHDESGPEYIEFEEQVIVTMWEVVQNTFKSIDTNMHCALPM